MLQNDQRRKPGLDIEALLAHPSVRSWYDSKKAKKTMEYRLASFVEWRRTNGLPTDPEQWLDECLNGSNLTLIKHARGWSGRVHRWRFHPGW
jgi:hypothetical protein